MKSRAKRARVAAIGVFIQGRDMGNLVKEMQARVRADVRMPAAYYVRRAGEFENQERAMAPSNVYRARQVEIFGRR